MDVLQTVEGIEFPASLLDDLRWLVAGVRRGAHNVEPWQTREDSLDGARCVVPRSRPLQLLREDPNDRLGSGPLGAESIRSSPYFAAIDWGPLDMNSMLADFNLGFAPTTEAPVRPFVNDDEWAMGGDL